MFMVVGLGNPGASYTRNRHNIGFRTVDALALSLHASPWKKKFQGLIGDGMLASERLLLFKPQTYMNVSGIAVHEAAHFYKIDPAHLIVVHDDLDLAPGKIRVKRGGSAGGHNGLKSIDAHYGAEYKRVRIGIGHPGDKDLVSPYVLANFPSEDESTWIGPLMTSFIQHFPLLLSGDDNGFMTRVTSGVSDALAVHKG